MSLNCSLTVPKQAVAKTSQTSHGANESGISPTPVFVGDTQKLALFDRSKAIQNAEKTLRNHHLSSSFVAHFSKLLEEKKPIRIGIIDDFKNSTHGRNVVMRILENMPSELRGKVEIVRYDVGGLNADQRAKVITAAADDAQKKKLVALSVSGGINAYSVSAIEKAIGEPLKKESAQAGYDALVKANQTSIAVTGSFEALNAASKSIPVVTPVWNDGKTTMAALRLGGNSGNGMITSIEKPVLDINNKLYNATDISGLVDVRVPARPFNPNSSQSAPSFIADMLSYALEEHKLRQRQTPDPKPSGYGNGGLPI